MKPILRFNEQFDRYGINRKIVKRNISRGDYGLFVLEPIAKGELIYFEDRTIHHWDDVLLRVEEVAVLTPQEFRVFWRFCTQIGINEFSGPLTCESVEKDIGYFMNHSCDPSAWYIDDEAMEARRELAPGEEITYDYCTCDIHDQYFECQCGSPNCRRQLSAGDWKLMKPVYGEHYLSYINQLEKRLDGGEDGLADYLQTLNLFIREMEEKFSAALH